MNLLVKRVGSFLTAQPRHPGIIAPGADSRVAGNR
jgi:hypothetical protein